MTSDKQKLHTAHTHTHTHLALACRLAFRWHEGGSGWVGELHLLQSAFILFNIGPSLLINSCENDEPV